MSADEAELKNDADEAQEPVQGFQFNVYDDGSYRFGQKGCDNDADLLLLIKFAENLVVTSAIKNKSWLKKKE